MNWPTRGVEEARKDTHPNRYDVESPVFLYQSQPYLRGKGLDLQVVQHSVVVTVLHCINIDLEELIPAEYPIIDYFWAAHPSTIPVFNCNGNQRCHLKPNNIGAHCYECDGFIIGFNSNHITSRLQKEVTWPIPAEAVLTLRTTIQSIENTSVADLQSNLNLVKEQLKSADTLIQEQDVETRCEMTRLELERTYTEKVTSIKNAAAASLKTCAQLKRFGLDKETLQMYEHTLLVRISEIEKDNVLAQLRAEVNALNAKIAELSGDGGDTSTNV